MRWWLIWNIDIGLVSYDLPYKRKEFFLSFIHLELALACSFKTFGNKNRNVASEMVSRISPTPRIEIMLSSSLSQETLNTRMFSTKKLLLPWQNTLKSLSVVVAFISAPTSALWSPIS